MAKKNKRQKASKRGAQDSSKAAAELADRMTARAPSTSRASEFNPDYTYVKRDLSRIGILAGSFFVILVVLSFFLK